MTNQQEALKALDELYRFFDSLTPTQREQRDKAVSTIKDFINNQVSE